MARKQTQTTETQASKGKRQTQAAHVPVKPVASGFLQTQLAAMPYRFIEFFTTAIKYHAGKGRVEAHETGYRLTPDGIRHFTSGGRNATRHDVTGMAESLRTGKDFIDHKGRTFKLERVMGADGKPSNKGKFPYMLPLKELEEGGIPSQAQFSNWLL